MSSKPSGSLRKAWFIWKSLRLPWRKRFFVGQDPSGNTYYELRQPRGDAPQSAPYRRLVHYPRSTPYSEVRVPPAWHQWLRYQRGAPPSMEEQVAELQRQARIKVLAAEADARWDTKPSLLDMPATTATATTTPTRVEGGRTVSGAGTGRHAIPAGEREHKQEQGKRPQRAEPPQETQRERGDGDIHAKQTRGSPQTEPALSNSTDPWKRAQRGAPGETWQPTAWTPAPAKKR
ncbi:hypothetical protein F5Y10DRAFT_242300 [Nemania abortiva]|nr:hypothetical protein F5Y10DRAFT_242300 [Nemania abortiva]